MRHHGRVERGDRVFNMNCYFRQYVNEWAIDTRHFPKAIQALKAWVDSREVYVHFPVEA